MGRKRSVKQQDTWKFKILAIRIRLVYNDINYAKGVVYIIQKLGQVMVYVNDQAGAVSFWTEKAGFVVIAEEDHGEGMRSIEIAPTAQSETTLVLN